MFNFFLFNRLLNNGLMVSISRYFCLTLLQKEKFQNNTLNLVYNILLDTKICPQFFTQFVQQLLEFTAVFCGQLQQHNTTSDLGRHKLKIILKIVAEYIEQCSNV